MTLFSIFDFWKQFELQKQPTFEQKMAHEFMMVIHMWYSMFAKQFNCANQEIDVQSNIRHLMNSTRHKSRYRLEKIMNA